MSHNVHHSTYDENVNKRAVQDYWDDYAMHADWQEGCSGLLSAIRWIDHICDNYEDAERYIESHDDGNYDQLAVKYRVYPRIEPSKTMISLQERLKKETVKKAEYEKEHSIASFKAEFVGCPNCGSKLKKELLKGDSCPLCRTELRSKTTMETLARYEKNIKELVKQIKEEERKLQAKMVKKSKIKWLVKIEYHT